MAKILKRIGIGILFVIGILASSPWWLPYYQRLFQTDEIRFRITVSVDDNGKTIEGSSVIAAYHVGLLPFYLPEPITGRRMASGFQGESVVVDLDEKGQIFTVLQWGAQWPFEQALGVSGDWRRILSDIRNLKRSGGTAEVIGGLRPMLVTFGDSNIPGSVKEIDPDNLAKTFGDSVRLKSITVTVVNNNTPITKGEVEKKISWLPEYYNKRLDGERYGNAFSKNLFANTLASGNFKVGGK